MLFNSIEFAVFFPLVFTLYWLFHKSLKSSNLIILLSSYIFYGFWDWRFLILIFMSSLIDFIIGNRLKETFEINKRKFLLFISLSMNLGFLIYFKYVNFFIESFLNSFSLFGNNLEISTLKIILPVGISFYTFQTLSYTIDVYNKKIVPTNKWLPFFTFVSFFPQLVAGPIERASNLLPQFHRINKFDYQKIKSGLLLISFGLFKKMVIADRAALYVNEVYSSPDDYGGVALLISTIFFAIQIYCDFSGYTDIAIGTARAMGFNLLKNFKSPYFSKSLTEFWHRWHISLSSWFRDYLYIPLGGSRRGNLRTYFNIFVVFVISGLWHGAAWTFIIWGAIHGLILIIEKITSDYKKKYFRFLGFTKNTISNHIFFSFITFFIICISWVFFRASSLNEALEIIIKIFLDFDISDFLYIELYLIGFKTNEFIILILSVIILFTLEVIHNKLSLFIRLNKQSYLFRWSIYFLILFSIIFLGVYGDDKVMNFIYFQF